VSKSTNNLKPLSSIPGRSGGGFHVFSKFYLKEEVRRQPIKGTAVDLSSKTLNEKEAKQKRILHAPSKKKKKEADCAPQT